MIKEKLSWKQALNDVREKWYLANYQAARDFGVPTRLYSDKTANGLTKCVVDFLTYSGHYANRINSVGMVRKINGKSIWTKGTTNCGTGDISAIINGRAISIEVKIGRDKMSEYQIQEQARIESAGGVYIVAKDMEGFYDWYQNFINN